MSKHHQQFDVKDLGKKTKFKKIPKNTYFVYESHLFHKVHEEFATSISSGVEVEICKNAKVKSVLKMKITLEKI